MPAKCAVVAALVVFLAGGFRSPANAQILADAQVAIENRPISPRLEILTAVPSVESMTNSTGYYRLTLDEARSRALSHSVVMDLASLQVAAKCHALHAAQKDYLPKLLNAFAYFHFDSDLGTVLTTPGILNPAQSIAVPFMQQDSPLYTAAAIQPITPLLKVREAVNVSAAEVGAAEAQRDFARRELEKGVQQLYFGLHATQQIRSGLAQAVAGAEQLAAAMPSPDARISLIEAQQGLLSADGQLTTLSEQMNGLVGLPAGTRLALDEPPRPVLPFNTADEAVAAAVANSPRMREARRQLEMAEAALRVAKSNYVPNVMAYGFYVNQNATPVMQEDFTGVGMSATYMLEWGKKGDLVRASMATLSLARGNVRKQADDASLEAAQLFHAANHAEQALRYAEQLAELHRERQPSATDPAALKAAAHARLEAEVALIKAELAFQSAVVALRAATGHGE